MFDMALVHQCAPQVSPQTIVAIIRTESNFNPLALHVNGDFRLPAAPRTAAEATAWAEKLIQQGYSVDMGLMQINSRNLGTLNLTPAEAFDPCRNLRAGARILTANYLQAAQTAGRGTQALLEAISAYNTGNFRAGFRNGYVKRVASNATPVAQPATRLTDEDEVCWWSSCVAVNLSRIGRWLTFISGAGIAALVGYFFGMHRWAREGIGAGLQAVRDRLPDMLR
jgi:type IV secretion system protein VirB1